jgi:hypothetical protein
VPDPPIRPGCQVRPAGLNGNPAPAPGRVSQLAQGNWKRGRANLLSRGDHRRPGVAREREQERERERIWERARTGFAPVVLRRRDERARKRIRPILRTPPQTRAARGEPHIPDPRSTFGRGLLQVRTARLGVGNHNRAADRGRWPAPLRAALLRPRAAGFSSRRRRDADAIVAARFDAACRRAPEHLRTRLAGSSPSR